MENKENLFIQNLDLSGLEKELSVLKNMKSRLQKNSRRFPQGNLIVSKWRNTSQFYLYSKESKNRRKYLSKKKNQNLIQRLAQKKYDKLFLEQLDSQIFALKNFVDSYKPEKLSDIYKKLPEAIKDLVEDHCEEKEKYISEWRNEVISKKEFFPDGLKFSTSFGLKVRSKSEVMIAETLQTHSIPFKYEVPMRLRSYGLVHPDFLCLNTRTLEEIVWEHFGLMDESEYANNALKKIRAYQQNKYIIGKTFFFTQETKELPLDMNQILYGIKNILQ